MIRADINENINIVSSLLDENTGLLSSGDVVYYDIRDMSGNVLTPPVNGILTESNVVAGIYSATVSLGTAGNYICYVTCSGFVSTSEDILINAINVYDLVKSINNHNISVENVLRLNVTATASQTARKVPLGYTDYVTTIVRPDGASDWSSVVSSGTVYAHYKNVTDTAPYKMGGAL